MSENCWCGGRVGPRDPGDANGLGCLDSVYHGWSDHGDPGKVRKLYVAGPMTGYPESNHPAFHEAAERLRDTGFEVVSPAEYGEGSSYVDLLREDLRVMLDCQGICVLEKWWESTGARNEVMVGGLLKMPVRTLPDWLARVALELQ